MQGTSASALMMGPRPVRVHCVGGGSGRFLTPRKDNPESTNAPQFNRKDKAELEARACVPKSFASTWSVGRFFTTITDLDNLERRRS
ncbi:hypothetical protein TcasGA2_TC014818 [Tribolium castaneum]|uniref:Uncharacterized protein n=1 Tax=Tribolium castaneum TaxID=7070 RepID=D6WK61_TRICA|nr:hypothetical protein TcasGA2_TC014818 [Tribolium castaneum]